ncbi:MAG: hypothetical protein RR492_07640, partial [Enterococcus sp.]
MSILGITIVTSARINRKKITKIYTIVIFLCLRTRGFPPNKEFPLIIIIAYLAKKSIFSLCNEQKSRINFERFMLYVKINRHTLL